MSLIQTLSRQAGIEPVDLDEVKIDSRVRSLIPAERVSKYNGLPLSQSNGRLEVAMSNPFDTRAMEEMRLVTGLSISRRYGHPVTLERTILKFYGSGVARMLDDLAPVESASVETNDNGVYSPAKLRELAREPSLVNRVNLILLEALPEAVALDVVVEDNAEFLVLGLERLVEVVQTVERVVVVLHLVDGRSGGVGHLDLGLLSVGPPAVADRIIVLIDDFHRPIEGVVLAADRAYGCVSHTPSRFNILTLPAKFLRISPSFHAIFTNFLI